MKKKLKTEDDLEKQHQMVLEAFQMNPEEDTPARLVRLTKMTIELDDGEPDDGETREAATGKEKVTAKGKEKAAARGKEKVTAKGKEKKNVKEKENAGQQTKWTEEQIQRFKRDRAEGYDVDDDLDFQCWVREQVTFENTVDSSSPDTDSENQVHTLDDVTLSGDSQD